MKPAGIGLRCTSKIHGAHGIKVDLNCRRILTVCREIWRQDLSAGAGMSHKHPSSFGKPARPSHYQSTASSHEVQDHGKEYRRQKLELLSRVRRMGIRGMRERLATWWHVGNQFGWVRPRDPSRSAIAIATLNVRSQRARLFALMRIVSS